MKKNTKLKSSITLPPDEIKLVQHLKKRTGAKSNVEVVRQGLHLLQEKIETQHLRESFRKASEATRAHLITELENLDHLSGDGLD